MKKFLVFAAITILLVGSIFSQNNVNPNLMTKQRQRVEEIQNDTPATCNELQQIKVKNQMQFNILGQEIEPITATGVVKKIVESGSFVEILVEIEDETYSLKIPRDLITDIKPEETIELTGFKIKINDFGYFKPLEIKYQERTLDMIQRREKLQTHNFIKQDMKNYQKNWDYKNFQKNLRFYKQPPRATHKK